MIPITEATKTALHQAVKQLRATITWKTGESETHTVTSEDRIISVKKDAEGYYCHSTLRKITIVLDGTDTDLLDQRVTVTVQVKTGANSWGDISWGSFNITEAKTDQEKGISTFTGYGGISALQDAEYQPGSLTFPTTVGGLATQIAGIFGIEIGAESGIGLPSDYQRLEYIEGDGNQYINTGKNGDSSKRFILTIDAVYTNPGTSSEIIGGTGGSNGSWFGQNNLLWAASSTNRTTIPSTTRKKFKIEYGSTGHLFIDVDDLDTGTRVVHMTGSGIGGAAFSLFAAGAGSYKSHARVYSATLTIDDIIERKFIPAKRTSDGTPGLYDLQNGQFYTSATSTAFIAGPVVDKLPNIDAPIAEDLWAKISGCTYRDILEEIAGATGTIAVIGRGDDTLDFNLPPVDIPSEILDETNLITSKVADKWGEVSAVVLSRQPQNDNIEVVDETTAANGRVDLVITNNQILDGQRETTAQPILDAVKGWQYRNGEIKTEGHGYHEIGDRLDVNIAGVTHTLVVTKSSITVDGGIKETLTSSTPEIVPIDYSKSGGITKTVFNTELAVDKQEQRIDAIVSRQDTTDAEVAAQFTQVTQNLTEIVSTVQSSGGGNLIRNSVGFGKEADGTLTVWTYGTGATTTTVKSQSSPASLNAGAVSGHEIMMTGASIISQDIALTPGETYTLALRAKKVATGAITIRVGNSSNNATITLANGTAYNWERQSVEFIPALGANTVTITVPASASFEITDLLLTSGGGYTWRQASGEIYNTQVSLDQDGVQVRSSVYTGDYTSITPLEFAGYSNASGTMQKVFSLNRDVTEVAKLEARDQIKMAPIKIVPVDNSTWSGWAFVRET